MSEETQSTSETHRERVRAAGLSGDYWYPAEWSHRLERGQVKEIVFWKQSIAVFRDAQGAVHALEDRCAHRHIKLSLGAVEGCNLTCAYHGWVYDGGGACVGIPHETKAKNRPDIRVRSYPAVEKYGIVWIFPGDPEKAATTALPNLWPLDHNWAHIPVDFVWKSHHSMIVDNVCDFYHEYLHRDYRPFFKPKLLGCEQEGDSVMVHYETTLGGGPLVRYFANHGGVNLNTIKVYYDYPYQRSDIDGKYLHWLFLRPIDEETTHCFFVFTFNSLKIPLLGWKLPRMLQEPVMKIAQRFYVLPVLHQDGWILEAEQAAHTAHKKKPSFEFNPFVHKASAITLRKWEEFEASEAKRLAGKGKKRPALNTVSA